MSHHISDVIFWGGDPDRNYYVFVVLSILFGFFGLDHFYLRSYATGTQKFLFNLVSLGMWHWWDVSQIVGNGEKIRKEGLSGPFDWMHGIGRGTFTPPPTGDKEAPCFEAPKSYLLYTFLAVFFGWLGMDKFYLGNWGQGLLKVISCFNLFLILFGWLWVCWDAFHAFFMTDSILRDGITAPIPYSMLFTAPISADVFRVQPCVDNSQQSLFSMSFLDWTQKNLGAGATSGLSFGSVMTNVVNHANNAHTNIAKHAEKAVTVANAAINAAVIAANAPAVIVANAPVVATNTPAIAATNLEEPFKAFAANAAASSTEVAPVAAPASTTPRQPIMMLNGANNTSWNTAPTSRPQTPEVPQKVAFGPTQTAIHAQAGGGGDKADGPGPVIAGALSALILAGGLKGFYDVISKQYG